MAEGDLASNILSVDLWDYSSPLHRQKACFVIGALESDCVSMGYWRYFSNFVTGDPVKGYGIGLTYMVRIQA